MSFPSFSRSRDRISRRSASATVTAGLLMTVFAVATVQPAMAQTFSSQIIDGKSVIYYPGDSATSSGLGGVAQPTFSLIAGTGRVLTFSSVTGQISFNGGGNLNDADGIGNTNSTNILSANSISGISFPNRAGYLVGVFLNGSPSGAAPASLAYDAVTSSQTSYSPLIDQTFFIGDGLTGDGVGSLQQFLVPDDATTLVLGFADAPGYNGSPGSYGDNTGSFTASFAVSGAAPEPGALALALSGGVPAFGTLALRKLRRRSRK